LRSFVYLFIYCCFFITQITNQGRNQFFISRGEIFHEILFDDIIVLIQPWYNFFANRHSESSLRNISENENFSVLIKMQTERSGQSKN